ncbi:MAG: leucine-rich repeat domain-containing protein [Bacteroidaceae bacterium]|nr:leucine-rich repeat domain-containing protein [Bacteroidaceae bacterium]
MKKLFLFFTLVCCAMIAGAEVPPDDEIWYEAMIKIELARPLIGDARVVSNEYDVSTGKWIIKLDRPVTAIDGRPFRNSFFLQSISLPNSVKSIDEEAFRGCSTLTTVNLNDGVESIGESAFFSCRSLTSVTIPDNVTSIWERAFLSCSSLASVSIGAGVTNIRQQAFDECTNLTDVKCWAKNPPSVGYDGFITFGTLHVRRGCKSAYEAAGYWKEFNPICDDLMLCTVHVDGLPEQKVTYKGEKYGNGSILHHVGDPLQISDFTPDEVAGYEAKVSIVGEDIYVDYDLETLDFADAETYDAGAVSFGNVINYTRSFNNTEWQALYVPFAMNYDEWSGDCDIAKILNIIEYDDDDNGTVDRTYLVVVKLTSGSTKANTPYLIRAKNEGDIALTLTDKRIEAAASRSTDCRSTENSYTFTGTYAADTDMYAGGYYALSDGILKKADSAGTTLKPQRWYLEITPREGGAYAVKKQSIDILVKGETEGISTLSAAPSEASSTAFDLTGRSVKAGTKGISIVNGRKVVR